MNIGTSALGATGAASHRWWVVPLALACALVIAPPQAHAQPTLDGTFDGNEVWGDPVASNTTPGWQDFNATHLYVTFDADYVYVGAQSEGIADWKSYGFILNIDAATGGAADPWGRQIAFAHDEGLPDLAIRGNYDGGWAEFRNWENGDWTGGGVNVVAEGGVSTSFVEFRVPRARFGAATTIDVQFFITGNQNAHGTFDAVPADEVADAWEPVEPTVLQNYATAVAIADEDDDVITIAAARALATGTIATVEGVVTRAQGRHSFIQDETGAIGTFQTTGTYRTAIDEGAIAPGTVVRVTGEVSRFFDLVQISPINEWEVVGQADLPEPLDVTLDDIRTAAMDDIQGRLVRVQGVTGVNPADPVWEANKTYTVTDPSIAPETIELRTPVASDTEVDGQPVPETFTYVGVVGWRNVARLWPIGAGDIIPVVDPVGEALVQVIHNAPDPALLAVDVYLDGEVLLEGFAFRTATAFTAVPAGNRQLTIVAENDNNNGVTVFDEEIFIPEDATLQVVVQGVLEPDDFPANPDGIDTGLQVQIIEDALTEAPAPDVVLIRAIHGAPDAPTVSVSLRDGETLFGPFAYKAYTEFVSAPPLDDLILDIAANGDVVASFEADLGALGGHSATAIASGFLAAEAGVPSFELIVVLADGTVVVLPAAPAVSTDPSGTPMAFELEQNYPNPFNASTTIAFSLAEASAVTINVYDLTGRLVSTLVDTHLEAGRHEAVWNANGVASGVYLYRIQAGEFSRTLRALIVR